MSRRTTATPVAAAQDADDDDRDEQARERVHEVDPAHDHGVDDPAEVAGEQPEQAADQHRADGDHRRPDDAGAGADQQAGEDVAAEVVRPEPVLAARPADADLEVLGIGECGRDQAMPMAARTTMTTMKPAAISVPNGDSPAGSPPVSAQR